MEEEEEEEDKSHVSHTSRSCDLGVSVKTKVSTKTTFIDCFLCSLLACCFFHRRRICLLIS